MSRREEWAATYHEAGHAVIASRFGASVVRFDVNEDGTGLVRWKIRGRVLSDLQYAAICWAGPLAERRYGVDDWLDRAAGDWASLRHIDADTQMRGLALAQRLVDSCWDRIQGVACARMGSCRS